MEAPYYKSTPRGYVLTYRTPPNHIDPSKQLPVYRVVNEFMNLEDRQDQQKPKETSQSQKIYVDILNFRSVNNTQTTNQVRYLSRDPSRVMEKEEVKSVYTIQEAPVNTQMSDYHHNARNLNNNNIELSYSQKYKVHSFGEKTQTVTGIESVKHSKVLEFELEKERILRKNLEKSYRNLLKDLQQRELVFNIQEHSLSKCQDKNRDYPLTERVHATTPKVSSKDSQNNKSEHRMKRRNSYVIFNEVEELCHAKNAEEKGCNCHKQIHELSFQDRQFKLRMNEEMSKIQTKIQQMNKKIITSQRSSKEHENKTRALELQNQLLKRRLENKKLQESVPLNNEILKEQPMAKREHMHYMFTILMMFLCFAMVCKNRQ